MPRLSFNFRGFIAPVFTPFNDRGSLNLSIIPNYAKYLSDNGVNGVLVNGTSGEGMAMSVSERIQVAEAWANAVKVTKQHLMIQVGGAPLPDVLQLTKHAEKIKADSILCLPDLYFKPQQPRQLIKYLKIVGEAAPNTPLLYYHIPMFTNVNIHMGQCFEEVGDAISTFVGIKFTSTNLEEGAQALSCGKFVVFLGSDQIMSAACAVGMNSFIPTSVNIFPDLALKILDAGKNGDMNKANEYQKTLSKAVITISKYGNWVATMKVAMALITPLNFGNVRAPIEALSEQAIVDMKKDLEHLGYKIYNS